MKLTDRGEYVADVVALLAAIGTVIAVYAILRMVVGA